MREIIFRGKRLDNGEWVEGYFMPRPNENKIYIVTMGGTIWHEVDHATVGQYTGLTDKNGKRIFEGDIVRFADMGIYPVWWDADYKAFGSCWFSDFDHLSRYNGVKMEVIGNIHDNPELLEAAE